MTGCPEFPKINAPYKRDEKGRFRISEFATPEIELLQNIDWTWRAKVDGTSIRIHLQRDAEDGSWYVDLEGRTDRAQIPPKLLVRLKELFGVGGESALLTVFGYLEPGEHIILYGEGYGSGIQKGGGDYIPDGVDFILFDVLVEGVWLAEDSITDIAESLGIQRVPILGHGKLFDAEHVVMNRTAGLGTWYLPDVWKAHEAMWPNKKPEGLVLVPPVSLFDRRGNRIATKVKLADYPQFAQ
jgi:hypothetical protein